MGERVGQPRTQAGQRVGSGRYRPSPNVSEESQDQGRQISRQWLLEHGQLTQPKLTTKCESHSKAQASEETLAQDAHPAGLVFVLLCSFCCTRHYLSVCIEPMFRTLPSPPIERRRKDVQHGFRKAGSVFKAAQSAQTNSGSPYIHHDAGSPSLLLA